MIKEWVNRNDDVGLCTGNQAQKPVMNERSCQCIGGQDSSFTIATMKHFAKQFRVIADCRAVELDGFPQGKAAVLLEHIDGLNAISRGRKLHESSITHLLLELIYISLCGTLTCLPFFLLLLRDQANRIGDSIGCATMARSRISYQEQDSPLCCSYQKSHPLSVFV